MPGVTTQSFSLTHVGKVREVNEDALVCREEIGLWAVADGMGGHEAGDLASRIVTRCLEEIGPCNDFDELEAQTRSSLERANAELVELKTHFDPSRSPASTVAVLLIKGNQGAAIWAGDSRVYRVRDGLLKQITHDHSHVQDLVDRGELAPEDAESHPHAHYITRAMGLKDKFYLETHWFEVRPGDRYLACTDGLSRLLNAQELCELTESREPEARVNNMMEIALARGAPDNVTLIAVDITGR